MRKLRIGVSDKPQINSPPPHLSSTGTCKLPVTQGTIPYVCEGGGGGILAACYGLGNTALSETSTGISPKRQPEVLTRPDRIIKA